MEAIGGVLVLIAVISAWRGATQLALVALLGVPVAAAAVGFVSGIQGARREASEGSYGYKNEGREQGVSLHSVPRTDSAGAEVSPLDPVQIDDTPAPHLVRLPSPDGAE